eukprot:TRINITY_DN19470_c2_g1_i1.p1 TRINITY_DN19470_c2_g1~~TRINITY_DN19470_c2_g1_i1.p1  ORF type:complete len:1039 (-),score=280.62 TRINITY_DN19470_c2_g1_i1:55-2757(-)
MKRRFGRLDAAWLARELTTSGADAEKRLAARSQKETQREMAGIFSWRREANARLKRLRRRAALAFMSLPPNADDAEASKAYKRLALEFHPDKGGDPEEFQTLQEMRQRVVGADGNGGSAGDDEDEDGASATGAAPNGNGGGGEDEDGDDLSSAADEPEQLAKARVDLHRSAVRLWDRAQRAREEVVTSRPRLPAGASRDAAPVLRALRSYAERFAASELSEGSLASGDATAAMGKLRKFLHNGVEILAAAAAVDAEGAAAVVVNCISCIIVARSGSPAIQNVCAALLRAMRCVPDDAAQFLSRVAKDVVAGDAVGAPAPTAAAGEAADAAAKAADEAAPLPADAPSAGDGADAAAAAGTCGSGTKSAARAGGIGHGGGAGRGTARAPGPKSDAATCLSVAPVSAAASDDLAQLGLESPAGALAFEPPPIPCGASLELRLRMTEASRAAKGAEELHAALHRRSSAAGAPVAGAAAPPGPLVAELRAVYVLRAGPGAALSKTSAAMASTLAPGVVDAAGRPVPEMLGQLASGRALAGGLLVLQRLVASDAEVEEGDLDLMLLRSVLKCLVGPMKRVTLVLARPGHLQSAAAPGAADAAVRWERVGFRRCLGPKAGDWWFLEPSASGLPQPRAEAEQRPDGASAGGRGAGAGRSGKRHRPNARPAGERRRSGGGGGGADPPSAAADAAAEAEGSERPPKRPRQSPSESAPILPPTLGAGTSKSLGGLTPRMRYALVAAADMGANSLRADLEHFVNGQKGGRHWGSECLPEELQGNVYKAFVRGMAELCSAFGALLRRQRLPTREALDEVLSPYSGTAAEAIGLRLDRHAVSHFFAKGGKAEYVVAAILRETAAFVAAREQAENTEDLDQQSGSEELRRFGRYHALPLHMLDGDMDFLRELILP